MAATGTPTTNIGLRRPQGTDPASVDDINYNSELIDTKLGAVGSTSVQEQINTLNSNIATKATDETAGGAYSDLNSLRTTGFYQYGGSSTGAPTTNGGSLICCFGSGGTQGMQIAHPNNQTFLSIRAYNNGTWTNWSNLTLS